MKKGLAGCLESALPLQNILQLFSEATRAGRRVLFGSNVGTARVFLLPVLQWPRVQQLAVQLPPLRPRCLLPDTNVPGVRPFLDGSLAHADLVEKGRTAVLVQKTDSFWVSQHARRMPISRLEE